MITGYAFHLSCPSDGALMEPITEGRPIAGTRAGAVAECTECHHQWLVAVELTPVTKSPDRRSSNAKACRTPSTMAGPTT